MKWEFGERYSELEWENFVEKIVITTTKLVKKIISKDR